MQNTQDGAFGHRAIARRAMKNEVVLMILDTRQNLVLYTTDEKRSFFEMVKWLPGDRVALDHIPDCLDGQYELDGVEEVYVSEDGCHFRFPHHKDRLIPIKNFANNCVTATVVNLAGAGFRVKGQGESKRLIYDEFGATLEGR